MGRRRGPGLLLSSARVGCCQDLSETPLRSVFVLLFTFAYVFWGSQVALMVKSPPTNAEDIRDVGLIPGSTQVQGQGQVLLTAVSSVQRTEPEREIERCTEAQRFR